MISIFVPTSGRPAMFGAMLKSLRETTVGYEVEIVAVIDDDLKALFWAHEYNVDIIDYSQTRRGALNAWNLGLQLSTGDVLVPAGDDQLFHPDWLRYALESHQNALGGSGVVGMNDLAYDGNTQVATMFLFDREYCKTHMGGIFAPPCYHYYCIDSEWNEKAKMLGKYIWDNRSIVEHLHSAHLKRPVDTTDSYKEDKWMEEDNRMFQNRKLEGFPITWESLI